MPVVLVIIIVAAWIVILAPKFLNRRSRTVGEIGSISHFHHQLAVLEHSAPQPIVAPAYRLRAVGSNVDSDGGSTYPEVAAVPVLSVVGAKELPRPALAFLGEAPELEGVAARPSAPVAAHAAHAGPDHRGHDLGPSVSPGRVYDSLTRQKIRRRRRDALGVIAMVFLGTMMIGFVPGAAVVWVLTALSGVVMAAYVALLVNLRRRAEERERKLHYLRPDGSGAADGTGSSRVAPYSSGRYAHPSNGAVAAR
jgi:hypothetical protein